MLISWPEVFTAFHYTPPLLQSEGENAIRILPYWGVVTRSRDSRLGSGVLDDCCRCFSSGERCVGAGVKEVELVHYGLHWLNEDVETSLDHLIL